MSTDFPTELEDDSPVLWGIDTKRVESVGELKEAVQQHKTKRNQVFAQAKKAYNLIKQEFDACKTEKQNIQQQQSRSEQDAKQQAEQAQEQTAKEKKRADDAEQKFQSEFKLISDSLFQGGASHDTWQTAWMTRARSLGGHGGKGGVYRAPLHR